MAWLNITDRTGADPNSSADIDQLMENERVIGGNGNNAPTGDLTDHETRIDALEIATAYTIVVKNTDYAFLDDDGIGTVIVDSRTGQKTQTFPTAADNVNRTITIKVGYVGGAVICDSEGAETFEAGENSVASIKLMNKGDILIAQSDGTAWQVLKLTTTMQSGWINRSDWTNVHLGNSQCPYDGLSGTFTVGEVITEATSNNTGIIISDSGSLLVLKNVTGTGIWTNDRQITGGTSGATANVNVSTSTKNADTAITHNFGVNIKDIFVEVWYSENTTGVDGTAKSFPGSYSVGGYTYGMQHWGLNTNTLQIQVADSGFFGITETGGFNQIDSEDWSYKVIVRWEI